MSNPSAAAERIAAGLRDSGLPVLSFGLFGSARFDPQCRDIDILLICETPGVASDCSYQNEMDQIARLMGGEGGGVRVQDSRLTGMASLLRQRIARVGASERLARKLLQALGTISGSRTCNTKDLLDATFAPQHPLRLALECRSMGALPVENLCENLLEELSLRADAMEGSARSSELEPGHA